MRILINCSNLKIGGGLQVAHSFLNQIKDDKKNSYLVVLSSVLEIQINQNNFEGNFKFVVYDIAPSITKIISGKDKFLDSIVQSGHVETVFSIFGPTYWKPSVKHLVGYAKPQYVYPESPFFSNRKIIDVVKLKLKEKVHLFDFARNNDLLITENKDVSSRLGKKLKDKKIHTVTNYYNQIFDEPELWNRDLKLPDFDGYTLLTISANYSHKNLVIIPKIVEYLNQKYPCFNFRFVVTVDKAAFEYVKVNSIMDRILCIGKVNVDQCPVLYSETDSVFLPTLLECFTATYPEAMRMEKPILTSDLEFAKGLCGNSALYFDPLNPEDIGEKIYFLSQDEKIRNQLVKSGTLQLRKFDTYQDRAAKYLELITS